MANALLGLGSNVGNREETLRAALVEIDALPDVIVRKTSEFHRSRPLGGPQGQAEFLNAAAVIQTKTPPSQLLDELHDIELRHGRETTERWGPRTLDIDLLLYENNVQETPILTLPHPRMSFRRFVLQPAAEVAGRMLHPVIGWSVERLLLHLDAASDRVAIVSPDDNVRGHFTAQIVEQFGARAVDGLEFAVVEQLWPARITQWLDMSDLAASSAVAVPATLPYAAAAFPKLTILIDAASDSPHIAKAQWSSIVRRPGRGPTLRLQASEAAMFASEITAAVEAVWPDLGL